MSFDQRPIEAKANHHRPESLLELLRLPNRSYVAVTVSLWTSTPFTSMETVHSPGVDDSCLFQNQ